MKRGCTLEAFADSDFSDDGHAFVAPRHAHLHDTLERSEDTDSLANDVESVKCYCNN